MHPGVGFPLERYVPHEGATICDIDIPAGTIVSMSANVIHMDKEVFGEDADQFRPERWLDVSSEQLKLMDRSFLAVGVLVLCSFVGADYCSLAMEHGHALARISPSWRWANSSPKSSGTLTSSGRRQSRSGRPKLHGSGSSGV